MIAPKNHDGVFRQPEPVQRIEHTPELRVHEADTGVISLSRLAQVQLVEAVVGFHGQRRFRDVVEVVRRALRKGDAVERIKVEVFLWRNVRAVRAEESHREKERRVLVLFEQLNRLRRDLPVRLLLVRALRREPRQRSTEPAAFARLLRTLKQRLLVLVASARAEGLVPRLRIVEPRRPDVARHPVVEHLPDARDVVIVLPKELRQRHHIRQRLFAEVGLEIENARLVRPQTREQRDAARRAERELRVGPLEAHTARRQPVDVRRLDERVAVASEVRVAVVSGDEEHIRLLCGGGKRGREKDDGEEAWQGEHARRMPPPCAFRQSRFTRSPDAPCASPWTARKRARSAGAWLPRRACRAVAFRSGASCRPHSQSRTGGSCRRCRRGSSRS